MQWTTVTTQNKKQQCVIYVLSSAVKQFLKVHTIVKKNREPLHCYQSNWNPKINSASGQILYTHTQYHTLANNSMKAARDTEELIDSYVIRRYILR
jgi:hypothetical protein